MQVTATQVRLLSHAGGGVCTFTGAPRPGDKELLNFALGHQHPLQEPQGRELQGDGKEILYHPVGSRCQTPGSQDGPWGLLWWHRWTAEPACQPRPQSLYPKAGQGWRHLEEQGAHCHHVWVPAGSCLGGQEKIKRKSAWCKEELTGPNTCSWGTGPHPIRHPTTLAGD